MKTAAVALVIAALMAAAATPASARHGGGWHNGGWQGSGWQRRNFHAAPMVKKAPLAKASPSNDDLGPALPTGDLNFMPGSAAQLDGSGAQA